MRKKGIPSRDTFIVDVNDMIEIDLMVFKAMKDNILQKVTSGYFIRNSRR